MVRATQQIELTFMIHLNHTQDPLNYIGPVKFLLVQMNGIIGSMVNFVI